MFSGKINFLKLCTYCAHHFYACFMCELSTESKDCLYILWQFLKKNYINVLDLQLFVSLRNMVFEYYGISFHPKRKPHSRSIFYTAEECGRILSIVESVLRTNLWLYLMSEFKNEMHKDIVFWYKVFSDRVFFDDLFPRQFALINIPIVICISVLRTTWIYIKELHFIDSFVICPPLKHFQQLFTAWCVTDLILEFFANVLVFDLIFTQ